MLIVSDNTAVTLGGLLSYTPHLIFVIVSEYLGWKTKTCIYIGVGGGEILPVW